MLRDVENACRGFCTSPKTPVPLSSFILLSMRRWSYLALPCISWLTLFVALFSGCLSIFPRLVSLLSIHLYRREGFFWLRVINIGIYRAIFCFGGGSRVILVRKICPGRFPFEESFIENYYLLCGNRKYRKYISDPLSILKSKNYWIFLLEIIFIIPNFYKTRESK